MYIQNAIMLLSWNFRNAHKIWDYPSFTYFKSSFRISKEAIIPAYNDYIFPQYLYNEPPIEPFLHGLVEFRRWFWENNFFFWPPVKTDAFPIRAAQYSDLSHEQQPKITETKCGEWLADLWFTLHLFFMYAPPFVEWTFLPILVWIFSEWRHFRWPRTFISNNCNRRTFSIAFGHNQFTGNRAGVKDAFASRNQGFEAVAILS